MRDRLIELIKETDIVRAEHNKQVGCYEIVCDEIDCYTCDCGKRADYLLANGVVLVDTNTVGFVTNRKPIQTVFGMPLDELSSLIKAKEEGRVIVSPCKVGQTVYSYLHRWKKEDGIALYQITNITITQNKKGIWVKKYRAMQVVDGKTIDWQLNFAFDDFGKTVFLTKEEAEKSLERRW